MPGTRTRKGATPRTVEHPDAPPSEGPGGQVELLRTIMRERGLDPDAFPVPKTAGEAAAAIDLLKDPRFVREPRARRPPRTVQVGPGMYRHSELLWLARDSHRKPGRIYASIYAGHAGGKHQWDYERGGIFVLQPGERVTLADPEITQILKATRQCLICNEPLPGRSRTLASECAAYFGPARRTPKGNG
jgi:hypothetical protein